VLIPIGDARDLMLALMGAAEQIEGVVIAACLLEVCSV
jgi:hypothetical protein